MKNSQLTTILENLGLTENEAKVYLAALSIGQATILKISKAAEIKRTTIYYIIESLKQKGLMKVEIKGWKKFFVAENPEKLDVMIKSRREELKNSLPEFLALYNLKGDEGAIKYYEGLEAVKSVYDGMLRDVRPHEDYLVVTDSEQWHKLDEKFFMNYVRKRATLNVNTRLLLQDSEAARRFKKIEKNHNEKIKILPKDTTLTTNLLIMPRRIVIHQLIPPILAIVIENKSMIQMHKELFELIWKSIKEE